MVKRVGCVYGLVWEGDIDVVDAMLYSKVS